MAETTSLDALLTSNMQLGSCSFDLNPETASLPVKTRSAKHVETLDGVQFFSWGMFLSGTQIELHWEHMGSTQFSSIETIFETDTQVIWRPGHGTNYNVQVMELSGEYFISLQDDANHRQNIDLILLIISEVS